MHRLMLVGLNHTTAPLEVREKVAFGGDERQRALAALREKFPEAEAVLLSTCNRVELYAARTVHGHPRVEEMIEFIAAFHGLAESAVEPHFYRKIDREAVEHLFTVASSLDSMVLGETQILGQVREAYDLASAASATGGLLNPLFQRAIAVGREVMNQTALGEGRLSVASVAVDYARQIFDHFADKTVLSIGAGKMAALVLQNFQALAPRRLLVCNRTAEKAGALCERFGGEPAAYEDLAEHLAAADIVISSTGAPHPIITRAMFEAILKRRRYRPIFLIDIALPRDIEPAVGEMENVYLYNIDDLQKVVAATQQQRVGATDAAKQIVNRQVDEFIAWHRTREMGPMIDRLYKRYQRMAQEEVTRTINKLGNVTPAEKEHLEELARRIVNKLLHEPVRTLRESDSLHGPQVQYLHTLERLFDLGDGTEQQNAARKNNPSDRSHEDTH